MVWHTPKQHGCNCYTNQVVDSELRIYNFSKKFSVTDLKRENKIVVKNRSLLSAILTQYTSFKDSRLGMYYNLFGH